MRKNKIFNVDTVKFKAMGLKDNPEFYSRDTDAYLTFTVPDESFEFDKALLYLINIDDGSVVTEIETQILGKANVEYELPAELTEHYGRWRGQIIFEKDGEKASSAIFDFIIKRFLTDERPPTLNEVESIAKLRREAKELIEVLEGMTYDNESLVDVLQAKDGELTLDARIRRDVNNLENKKADKAEVSAQLAHKVGGAVKAELEDLSDNVLSAIDGTGGPFNLLSIPQDKSVSPIKTTFFTPSQKNIVDKVIFGSYVSPTDGTIIISGTYALYSSTDFLTVLPDTDYSTNRNIRSLAFYDEQGAFISGLQSTGSPTGIATPFRTPLNATKIRATLRNDTQDLTTLQIEKGLSQTTFENYWQFNGEIKKKSIPADALKDGVIPELASKWSGKTFVSLGDSITWQDGRTFSDGALARGYQTTLKEKLGFVSYDNLGVSGRPMADGTSNGVGTVTTGMNVVDYSVYDLTIIASGTNDFKLDVPLGILGKIGDATFDRTTFCGAYRTLIEYILGNDPTGRIVLFTPLQRNSGGYDVNYTNPAGHKLVDYVNAIKEIGEMYGLPVCDMYANSGFTNLTLPIFTRDGLHPNNIGYARMGDYASSFINAV